MSADGAVHDRQLIRRGLRIVAGFARAHPVPFAVSVIGSVAMAVGTVASTVVLRWLTDDVVLPAFEGTQGGRSRWAVAAAVVLVALGRSFGVIVRRYFAGMTVSRVKNDLQLELGDHYLDMAPEDLRVASRGRLLAHADSDVEVATDMLSPLPFTIGVFTLLAISVASLALVDPVLMLVAVAMLPLVAVLNQLNAKISEGPAVDARESVAQVSAVAAESFDGALIVKTLGREQAELERFSVAARAQRDTAVRLGRIRAVFGALLDLLPDVGIIVLVTLGAWRVGNGHVTTGELVQAVALFSLLAFPMRVIGYFFGDLPPSVVAHDRVMRVLAGPTRIPVGGVRLADGPLAVSLRDVTVRHAGAPAVDRVDLDVAPGEVLALVGPTGCGKSTLLTAIADMVPRDEGTVLVGGAAVDAIDPSSLTRCVAVAWQQPFLLDATVRENVEFGLRLDDHAFAAAVAAAQFADVLEGLPDGPHTAVGERGVRLSGGQRQRLALARALARRPGLLLLDDATSAVDPVIEERILEAIRGIGSTMIVVAHRRSTIALADRVVLMEHGRITAVGTHEDLLRIPSYAALLEAYDHEPPPEGSGEGPAVQVGAR